mmetsp:Transcript_13030/g.25307  ORF Transcript_13030/g.25307 Transcript_13030/m.25307 type:complete len:245 (-) Transcript_13030:734-1468(-)
MVPKEPSAVLELSSEAGAIIVVFLLVSAGEFVHDSLSLVVLDKRDSATTKSSTSNARAKNTVLLNAMLNEKVDFRNTNLIVVAQRVVRLNHKLAKTIIVLCLGSLCSFESALVLSDAVKSTLEGNRIKFILDLLEFLKLDITKVGARLAIRLEMLSDHFDCSLALLHAIRVFTSSKFMLHVGIGHNNYKVGVIKVNLGGLVRTTVDQKSGALDCTGRDELVHNSAWHKGKGVLCLHAAECTINR